MVRARQVDILPHDEDYDFPAWLDIGTADPSPIPTEGGNTLNLPIKKRVGAAVPPFGVDGGRCHGTVFLRPRRSALPIFRLVDRYAESGVTVPSHAKAAVDTSNLSEGFIQVKYIQREKCPHQSADHRAGGIDLYRVTRNNHRQLVRPSLRPSGRRKCTVKEFENPGNRSAPGVQHQRAFL